MLLRSAARHARRAGRRGAERPVAAAAALGAPSLPSLDAAAAAAEPVVGGEAAAAHAWWPRVSDGRVAVRGMRCSELERYLVEELGEKPSRARQLWGWLYQRGKYAEAFEEMHDVSAACRTKLHEHCSLGSDLALEGAKEARDGTTKLLFRLTNGGGTVESVLIPSDSGRERVTLCVSSQLGCALNCQFCFTARMGLRRQLTTAQIVSQVVTARRLVGPEKLTNVVFMGMGEPLHNADAVLAAVDVLLDPHGLAFSQNRVTVSTSGLVPEMRRFCRESPAQLAVSLNATTDEVRSWIMPINRKYNLEALLGALREEFPRGAHSRNVRQQKVFFEYIMLDGVNDSDEDADRLVEIARTVPCKVNLIHFNPHDGASEFMPTPYERVRAFRDRLASAGIIATMRQSRGDDEMAACGQLGDGPGDAVQPPPRMKPPPQFRPRFAPHLVTRQEGPRPAGGDGALNP